VAVVPPGRVRRNGMDLSRGVSALRTKLNISDQPSVDDVADTALGFIADLERQLANPPKRIRIEDRGSFNCPTPTEHRIRVTLE
jgi:hypothetical protein